MHIHTHFTLAGMLANSSTEFTARLVVEYTQPEKPNDEILKQIEQAAAAKVKENLEIIVTTQTRAKAEAWYSAHPVNKQFIYERRPPPAHLNQLNILEIPGTPQRITFS